MVHYTDSAGRRINILNDRDAPLAVQPNHVPESLTNRSTQASNISPTLTYGQLSVASTGSDSPSSTTPNLLRNVSSDSISRSTEPISWLTPSFYKHTLSDSVPKYPSAADTIPSLPLTPHNQRHHHSHRRRESAPFATEDFPPANLLQSRRTSSLDDNNSSALDCLNSGSGRHPRRYPCLFRDTHHCDKTFTTSGHASRHSKIHTAEKSFSCGFPGCPKKFTRKDNLKQHLETHDKNKSAPIHVASRSCAKLSASSASSSKSRSDEKYDARRDKAAAAPQAVSPYDAGQLANGSVPPSALRSGRSSVE